MYCRETRLEEMSRRSKIVPYMHGCIHNQKESSFKFVITVIFQRKNILKYYCTSMTIIKGLTQLMFHNRGMKLALIARTDIGMKKGKIASQCAHAAVACYKQALTSAPEALKLWESLGQPKIVLRSDGDGEECLLRLFKQAETLNLVCVLIRDAGHTQVERESITVLGIGPGKTSLIDQITNNLKLL